MVGFIGVPPVFNITVFCFDNDNTLYWLTEGYDKEDFITRWYFEQFCQLIALYGRDHTGAKTHLWDYEKQQNLAILQRITEFTLEFDQQKLHDKARESFERYYNMYVSTNPQ